LEGFRWIPGQGFESLRRRADAGAPPGPGVSLQLPPLWDHHGHVASLGALLEQADLRGCPTEEAALAIAAAAASDLPAGAWVEGFGWDQNLWGGSYPDRAGLDALFPERPVLLRRVDGHATWANTAALRAAGVSEHASDPAGGAYLRENGRLTGILLDTAMEAVAAFVPPPAAPTIRRRLLAGLEHMKRLGLSGATDMGLDDAQVAVLCDLDAGGELPIPLEGFSWVRPGEPVTVRPHHGTRFRLVGLKLFTDGALGSRGAALREPYTDAPGERGLLLWENADLRRVLREASAAGLAVAVHAIGDRAAGQVLEAIAEVSTRGVRLEHAQILDASDVAAMAALGVVAGIQPCHYLSDEGWAPSRLGARMESAYRWGTLARAAVPLLMGTDFPIEDPGPGRNFRACKTREPSSERLSTDEVLRAYAPPEWARAFCGGTLAEGASLRHWEEDPAAFRFVALAPGEEPW
jgi:predicted amidohydrolase YtcJ